MPPSPEVFPHPLRHASIPGGACHNIVAEQRAAQESEMVPLLRVQERVMRARGRLNAEELFVPWECQPYG